MLFAAYAIASAICNLRSFVLKKELAEEAQPDDKVDEGAPDTESAALPESEDLILLYFMSMIGRR